MSCTGADCVSLSSKSASATPSKPIAAATSRQRSPGTAAVALFGNHNNSNKGATGEVSSKGVPEAPTSSIDPPHIKVRALLRFFEEACHLQNTHSEFAPQTLLQITPPTMFSFLGFLGLQWHNIIDQLSYQVPICLNFILL